MNKHTPGPWRFNGECEPLGGDDRKRGSAFQVWEDMQSEPRIIAEIVSTEDPSIGVTEGIANACLIAAAPELLESLMGLVNIATHPQATKAEIRMIANECRSVIRKASS